MKCLKCGMEIEDNSKFCGYCGNPVQVVNPTVVSNPLGNGNVQNMVSPSMPNNQVQNNTQLGQSTPIVKTMPIETNTVSQGVQPTMQGANQVQTQQPVISNQIPNDNVVLPQQPIQENTPKISGIQANPTQTNFEYQQNVVPENNTINEQPSIKPNKKSNSWIFILLGVVLAVVAAVLLVMTLSKPSSTNNSVAVLETAINNFVEKGKNSGTIVAGIAIDSEEQSVNVDANIKYQKLNDELNLEISVDKSELFDELHLFANLSKNNMNLYATTNIINMIAGLEPTENKWIKLNSDDLGLDLNFDFDQTENIQADLSKLGLDKKIVYLGKNNNLRHYRLTVDKELLEDFYSNYLETASNENETVSFGLDEDFEGTYNIDFYINDYNELNSISIDFTDQLNNDGITKAILNIEFRDFNNTTVTIPSEALNTTVDLQTYITEIMPSQSQTELGDDSE